MFEEKGIDKEQYCVRNVKLELNFSLIPYESYALKIIFFCRVENV